MSDYDKQGLVSWSTSVLKRADEEDPSSDGCDWWRGAAIKVAEKAQGAQARVAELEAELEQARKERDEERALRRQEYDNQERYRDALERIADGRSQLEAQIIARDALAGKGQTWSEPTYVERQLHVRLRELEAELEQARKVEESFRLMLSSAAYDRDGYRDALERIASYPTTHQEAIGRDMSSIARDALAGDKPAGWFGSPS